MDYIDLREEAEKSTANNGAPPPYAHTTAAIPHTYPPYVPARKSKTPLIIALVLGGLFLFGMFVLSLSVLLFANRVSYQNTYSSPVEYWDTNWEANWLEAVPNRGLHIWRDGNSGSFEIHLGDDLYIWFDGPSGSFSITGNNAESNTWSPQDWRDWINSLSDTIPGWGD